MPPRLHFQLGKEIEAVSNAFAIMAARCLHSSAETGAQGGSRRQLEVMFVVESVVTVSK
jgi:hypothetical protein